MTDEFHDIEELLGKYRPAGPADDLGTLALPILRSSAVVALREFARVIAVCSPDWSATLDSLESAGMQDLPWWDEYGPLGITGEAFHRVVTLMGRAMGTWRSAVVAVRIEQYRQAKGQLPDTLPQLEAWSGKKLPTDPFTGRSLHYRKTKDGYEVFSAGEDRKVNADKPINSPGDDSDWGLRVRLPSVTTQPTAAGSQPSTAPRR